MVSTSALINQEAACGGVRRSHWLVGSGQRTGTAEDHRSLMKRSSAGRRRANSKPTLETFYRLQPEKHHQVLLVMLTRFCTARAVEVFTPSTATTFSQSEHRKPCPGRW